MNTKSDLYDAHRRLLEEERQRLGDPPTADEILAYSRGQLSPEAEERIAELLACYPELARTLTEPIPADDAKPGEPGYVSDAELEQRWAKLQETMQRSRVAPPAQPGGRVLQFWRFTSGLAAALAVSFGALFWQARSDLGQPRLTYEPQVLLPDGARGGSSEEMSSKLTADGDSYLLVTRLIGERRFAAYRLEIVDADANRSLWKSDPLPARDNDSFSILVPRSFLKPGRYRVILFGIANPAEEQLATYSMHVAR